jgi:deoxyribodipyrimidine photo-lyase
MINQELANKWIGKSTTVFWFRRDLRLDDNAGLYHALKENKEVLPVFIFDTIILDDLEDKKDARVEFIHESLLALKEKLEENGGTLLVLDGDPVEIFRTMDPKAIYANEDYEPYAVERDNRVKEIIESKGSRFLTFKDQVIFEKDEVIKDNGEPYTVFTPYSKKWKSTLTAFYCKSFPSSKYFMSLKHVDPFPFPSLQDIGFEKAEKKFPSRSVKQSIIEHYSTQRDFPSIQGTSRLSVHLRFGTISIRTLVQIALKKNEVWLNELIWREFYQMILWHFPRVANKAFKSAYDFIEWRNDPTEFQLWCDGMTGYPIVDAGMRQLNETGFMHNRVRMIVASFLTKHLLIEWRWGEAYFAKKLLDFDLAANNGGWQWAAGSGCDAAPYFRIFNPYLQTERFDPELKYIKQWIPELGTTLYPSPIVDHSVARERALKVYKVALQQ